MDLHRLAVKNKHVITDSVKQISVVGNENKSLFGGKIFLNDISCRPIQMVGGLIHQKKLILGRKKNGQHHSCPLTKAECLKGPVQTFRVHPQLIHLYKDLPALDLRLPALYQFRSRFFFIPIRDGVWEIIKSCAAHYTSLVLISAHKKIKKRCLSLSVSAHKSQLPIRINIETYIPEHVIKASFITECKIANLYLCHYTTSSLIMQKKSAFDAESRLIALNQNQIYAGIASPQ